MISNNPRTNEEIDLFHFLRPLTNFARTTGNLLVDYLRLLYARRIIFILIFLFFTAIIYFSKSLIPRSYRVDGIFISQVIPATYCEKMISNLNSILSSSSNNQLVGTKMNIGADVASELYSIKISQVNDNFIVRAKDSASIFIIEARLASNNFIDSIQKGILHYLENDDFVKKRTETRVAYVNSLYKNLQEQIVALDTVKKIVNNSLLPRSLSGTVIMGEPVSPVEVYEAETRYYRESLELREEMAFLSSIQVVQPFLKRNDFNYPDLKYFLIYVLLAGFVMALTLTPLFGKKRPVK